MVLVIYNGTLTPGSLIFGFRQAMFAIKTKHIKHSFRKVLSCSRYIIKKGAVLVFKPQTLTIVVPYFRVLGGVFTTVVISKSSTLAFSCTQTGYVVRWLSLWRSWLKPKLYSSMLCLQKPKEVWLCGDECVSCCGHVIERCACNWMWCIQQLSSSLLPTALWLAFLHCLNHFSHSAFIQRIIFPSLSQPAPFQLFLCKKD